MAIVNMRKMKTGVQGIIVKVRGQGEMNRRLRDMGLVPGTEIFVQGRAPLYDPVNIKLRGNNLTLRNNEADFIEVEIRDEPSEKADK